MSAICPVCASSSLRGQVDADVVRRLTLSSIAKRHGLSSRAVRRHLAHLPEKLEGEASASSPSIYIGSMNVSVFVSSPEDVEDDGVQDQDDPGQEV